MSNISVRLDYYDVTASDGDKKLLKKKMCGVLSSLNEAEREFEVGTSSLNFDAAVDHGGSRIIGSIRILRTVNPKKGRIGTNRTEELGLAVDEGISEVTYFVYDFSCDKLLVQYNYHGPKVSHLVRMVNTLYKRAVQEKGLSDDGSTIRCSYKPIIVGSEIGLVLSARYITAITAKTRVPVGDGIIDPSASWSQLVSAYQLPGETDATLVLKNKSGGLMAALRSMLPHAQKIDDYDKFEVGVLDVESGNVETYNLINNRLKSEVIIPLDGNSKAVDADVLVSLMEQDFDAKIQQIEW